MDGVYYKSSTGRIIRSNKDLLKLRETNYLEFLKEVNKLLKLKKKIGGEL